MHLSRTSILRSQEPGNLSALNVIRHPTFQSLFRVVISLLYFTIIFDVSCIRFNASPAHQVVTEARISAHAH